MVKNMVGRAGRLGFSEHGTSYLLALTDKEAYDFWSHYVRGVPEDIISRFFGENTDLRSLVTSVLAATPGDAGLGVDDIVAFLQNSFGAFQRVQTAPNWLVDAGAIIAALDDLVRHEMVRSMPDKRYRLDALGKLAGENRIEVSSITRLVDAFHSISPESITEHVLVAAAQLTLELDQVNFPLNKKGGVKERQTWMTELQRQGVPYPLLGLLDSLGTEQHQGALRAKKTAGCFLWMTDSPLSNIEAILTKHGGAFNGAAGPLRSVSARTCDLLPTVARVAEILHSGLNLVDRQARLITRLEIGIPAEAVEVAQYAGLRLTRGDYRSLLAANLCEIDQLAQSTDDAVLACIGGSKMKLDFLWDAIETHRKRIGVDIEGPLLPAYEK